MAYETRINRNDILMFKKELNLNYEYDTSNHILQNGSILRKSKYK